MFEFEAAESTDLPLAVGDKILVLEKNDAWWKGRSNGREGIFPANYVEKIEESAISNGPAAGAEALCHVRAVADFDGTAANQLSLKVGDDVTVREKSDAGWWEGEIVRDGKKASGWFTGDYVVSIEVSPFLISVHVLFRDAKWHPRERFRPRPCSTTRPARWTSCPSRQAMSSL